VSADYMERTRSEARERGYVETVFGGACGCPTSARPTCKRRQGAERQAINAPMQGTAADLIKLAMVAVQGWIEQERLATKLVMQVHDELVFEVPEGELEIVKPSVEKLMTVSRRSRCRWWWRRASGPTGRKHIEREHRDGREPVAERQARRVSDGDGLRPRRGRDQREGGGEGVRAQGPPSNHPLIVHIADPDYIENWAYDVPPAARKLADHFWPGPSRSS
jgi:hypothetical protein